MKHIFFVLTMFALSYSNYAQNPIADFEVEIEYECNSSTAHYTNKSQYADSFLWNYDGHITTNFEPRGFNRGGEKTWNVTLIAYGQGASDTLSKDVYINNSRLMYSYESLDTNNFAPLEVQFHDESVINTEDTVLYSWDFGDGFYSEDENPIHTFEIPQTYYVLLKGIKNGDCELHTEDFIIVKDTAQKDEFDFIISGCLDETAQSPCGNSKNFELRNDSLIIWGAYYGNCGTKKTATIRYKGDTVVIKTWEVGLLATCSCGYCFEIGISNIYADSVNVIFNNQQYIARLTTVIDNQESYNSINVYPNPSDDNLTLDFQIANNKELTYEIIDLKGMIRQRGKLSSDGIIDLDDNLIGGLYILVLKDKLEIINQRRIIIK